MSLKLSVSHEVPEETARVARAACRKNSPAMLIRDELDGLYEEEQFRAMYAPCGQGGISPWQLAIVSILQYVEDLSDRQAVEAVRVRIDWKYALGLPLEDPGFDASVLSEFRGRLVETGLEYELLNRQLQVLKGKGLLKARGRQRTDSTHVLAAVRHVNRLMNVLETMRHALNELSRLAPDWLEGHLQPEWTERYGRRSDDSRLPRSKSEWATLAAQVGKDGLALLQAVEQTNTPEVVKRSSAIDILRHVWEQQYDIVKNKIRWRKAKDLPASAKLIMSPYDPEARQSVKRDTTWLGYKCHLTETCEEDAPHLITHVQTTPSTTQDEQVLMPIHSALEAKGLLPAEHLVDAGYTDSLRLADSQRLFGIDVVGPVSEENNWQAKTPGAFSTAYFAIDWERELVTCPAGQESVHWAKRTDIRGQPLISVRFSPKACAACALRKRCTRSETLPRLLSFRPKPQHLALQAARQRQTTEAFKEQYKTRAGVEGSFSQGVRLNHLRNARYLGLAKTRLQHVLTATALNLIRLAAWFDDQPFAQTRRDPFTLLAPTT